MAMTMSRFSSLLPQVLSTGRVKQRRFYRNFSLRMMRGMMLPSMLVHQLIASPHGDTFTEYDNSDADDDDDADDVDKDHDDDDDDA